MSRENPPQNGFFHVTVVFGEVKVSQNDDAGSWGEVAPLPKFNIALGSFIKYGDQFMAKPVRQTVKK